MRCSRDACPHNAEGKFRPEIHVYFKGHPQIPQYKLKFVIEELQVCAGCQALLKAKDLITEKGWRQLCAAAKKMEKPKLDRTSVFLMFEEVV